MAKRKLTFKPPTLEAVTQYFVEKGYTAAAAQTFHAYYEAGEPAWHDSEGKPVRSWKQKAIAVWFTDKNKAPSTKNDRAYFKGHSWQN